MNAVYPCRYCAYFNACGDFMRKVPCAGRKPKGKEGRMHEHRFQRPKNGAVSKRI